MNPSIPVAPAASAHMPGFALSEAHHTPPSQFLAQSSAQHASLQQLTPACLCGSEVDHV